MKNLNLFLLSLCFGLSNMAVTSSSFAMQIEDTYDQGLIEKQKTALNGVINAQKEQIRYLKVVVDVLTPRDENLEPIIEFLNGFHVYSWDVHWFLVQQQKKTIKTLPKLEQKIRLLEQKKYHGEAFRIYRGYCLSRLVLQNIAKTLWQYQVTDENFKDFQDLYRLYIVEVQRARTSVGAHLYSLEGHMDVNRDFLHDEVYLLSGMQESLVDASQNKDLSIAKTDQLDNKKMIEDVKRIHNIAQQPGMEGMKEAKKITSNLSTTVIFQGKEKAKNWCQIIDDLFGDDNVTLHYPSLKDPKIFEELLSVLFLEFSSVHNLVTEQEALSFMKKDIPEKIENIKRKLSEPEGSEVILPKIKKPRNKKGKKKTSQSKKTEQTVKVKKPNSKPTESTAAPTSEMKDPQQNPTIETPVDLKHLEHIENIENTESVENIEELPPKISFIHNPKYLREQEKIKHSSMMNQIQLPVIKLFEPGEIKFFEEILFSPLNVSNAYCWNDIVLFLTQCTNPDDNWCIKKNGNGSATQFTPPKRLSTILGSHHITVHAPHRANQKPMPLYCLNFLKSGFKSYGLIQIEKGIYTTRKVEKDKN